MAVSLKITKNTLINCLCKLFNNINLNNKEFLDSLIEKYGDNVLSQEGVRTFFNPIFKEPIQNLKTNRPMLYQIYWLIRGWSTEEAQKIIQEKYFKKDKVFFNNNQIYQYLIDNNPFKFNVKNTEFIKKFVNTINIDDDHITLNSIYIGPFREWINIFYKKEKRNKGYLTMTIDYYIARGYSDIEAKELVSKVARNSSKLCEEYYIKRGIKKEDAKLIISDIQKNNASFSKNTKKYWLKLGLSEKEANEKAAYYSRKQCKWGTQYWLNQGYSKDEAEMKIRELNGSCPECKKYNNDYGLYLQSMNNISKKQTEMWKTLRNDPDKFALKLKGGWLSHTSKAEKKCFDFLINSIDKNIKHETYAIIFPEGFQSQTKNNYFYACDGYLPITDQQIIIIEYDGGIGVYHNDEHDIIRDNEILILDNNVLGILRIKETFFKNFDINYKINLINNAIQKIKNCKEERIVIE